MITMSDVDLTVDYKNLRLLDGHLMHEVKRRGVEGFTKTYEEHIEEFRKDWSKFEFCYLLALLEYLDPSFQYDESVKMDKFVLDSYSYNWYINFDEEPDFKKVYEAALPSFKKRGILINTVDEAV